MKDVICEAGVTVRGVVRAANGDRVEGAMIRNATTFDPELHESNTRSDANGCYALTNAVITNGTIPVRVDSPRGRAQAELPAVPVADDVEWNPVIEAGQSLSIRVVDKDGAPVPNGVVLVRSLLDTFEPVREAVTDASGTVRFAQCIATEYSVVVRMGPESLPAFAGHLRPTEDTAVITISDPRSCGSVTLQVGGLPKPNPRSIEAMIRGRLWSQVQDVAVAADGSVFLGPIPAGDYRLRISVWHSGVLDIGSITVVPGETLDLGQIRVVPKSSITVAIDAVDGRRPQNVLAYAVGQDGDRWVLQRVDEGTWETWLAPGEYTLMCHADGRAPRTTRVTVPELQGVRQELSLEPGYPLTVRVKCPLPLGSEEATLCIESESGKPVIQMPIGLRAETLVWLAPGQYHLRVTSRVGVASGAVTVAMGSNRAEVELK